MTAPLLLSINNYHYRRGGAEAVYLDQQHMFEQIGWRTASFAMEHPSNIASPYAKYFVKEIEFGNDYGLMQKLAMAAKIIYSPEARRRMAWLLDDHRPDVAHVHSVYHHISPSVLPVLRSRGVPTVITTHDLKLLCPAYTMLRAGGICEKCASGSVINAFRHRCIKDSRSLSGLIALESGIHRLLGLYRNNVDRLIAPSKFYRDKFKEHGWPESKLEYVPNFVSVEDFEPHYDDDNYFVYVGRLSYEKGIATLVKAAAMADVRLVVVGDGPLRASLETEFGAAGSKVRFTGYQSGDELWNWVRNSRAMVLPSEWYENAPISILEAYACGKPVIGAAIGGIPELIEPDETGWLFESGSVDSLANVLQQVAGMSGQRLTELGRMARERVVSRHAPGRYRDSLISIYESIGLSLRSSAS